MKFSEGAWLWATGVEPHMMRRVQEYRVERDSLWVALLDRHGRNGVDSFEGLVLQMRITSPAADVLRVQVWHNEPARRGVTAFTLSESPAPHVDIVDDADSIRFTSGRVTARIGKKGYLLEFIDTFTGHPITSSRGDGLGYLSVANAGPHLMHRLQLGVGESIYGFGEQFTPLVKNGQSVRIWNEDGGTISEQAYKTTPFYLSSRGYGLLVNSPAKVEFEVATERVQQVQFSIPGESLDYLVFYGPEPKAALSKYTALTGRAPQVPDWSFGLWLSTSFTTSYDEKTINEFVGGMAAHGIPLSVFHFDCFWMKTRHWCNFQWDTAKFPDPAGMIQRLKSKGLKISLWINSYISSLSEIFAEGRDGGYFIRRKDGSVYQRDQWQPAMAIVDFTNPAAVAWYQEKLQALLDMGVDCFKTDFGERIPDDDVVYHDGSDPKLMHNYYPYLYNKAVFDLLEAHHGKGNAIVFARSATAGCQQFPVHWGGDCEATFESMAENLRGGLSFCMSGAAYWSHDIGGFSGKADVAVYKRWAAFGLLSTHSRLHGSESYRVPWLYDDEAIDVVRRFTKLKNRLYPYLASAAHEARVHGWPLMRSMFIEFPNDPACRHLDRQYMLGSSLLVAPVFRHDDVVEYYVPPGTWTDLLTGLPVEGGAWRSHRVDFMHIPLLMKPNCVVPMSENDAAPGWQFTEELTLNIGHLDNGMQANVILPRSDGEGTALLYCRREGWQIILESDGRCGRVRVLLHASRRVAKVSNGQTIRQQPTSTLLAWTDSSRPLVITLSD